MSYQEAEQNLIRNPYLPGSRYQTIKNDSALSTIPNSGVFRPKEARGRVDWIVFTSKALQARADLTADQKTITSRTNSNRVSARAIAGHKWNIDIGYNPMTQTEFNPVYAFLLDLLLKAGLHFHLK